MKNVYALYLMKNVYALYLMKNVYALYLWKMLKYTLSEVSKYRTKIAFKPKNYKPSNLINTPKFFSKNSKNCKNFAPSIQETVWNLGNLTWQQQNWKKFWLIETLTQMHVI